MNAIMPSRQKKRLLSLTPRNKGKLLPLIMPWPSRIRQTHLWQPYLLRNSLPSLSLSPAPRKQSNSLWVDLSSKLANNGKLISDKYKKHLKNNLYFYCGAGDHKLDSCFKKQTMVTPKGCSTSATTSKKPLEKQRVTSRTLHRLKTMLNFPMQQ